MSRTHEDIRADMAALAKKVVFLDGITERATTPDGQSFDESLMPDGVTQEMIVCMALKYRIDAMRLERELAVAVST